MLREFSKIHGLAGFRVGWAYTPSAVADVLCRVRQPNSLAGPSLAAAEVALREPERLTRIRVENARLRDQFSEALSNFGLESPPERRQFRHRQIRVRRRGRLREALKRRGIVVRPLTPYGLPENLRITIGTEEEMAAVAAAIGEIVNQ